MKVGNLRVPIENYGGNNYNNSRLFTSREYDKESGLYYLRARYYDSELGRFISRDPIGMADDVNLYSYVGNSPVMFTDPLGLEGLWYGENNMEIPNYSFNGSQPKRESNSSSVISNYINRARDFISTRKWCPIKQVITNAGDKVAEYTDYLLDSIDLYDMLESGGRGMQRAGTAAVEGGATTCAYGMSISLGCGAYTAYFATTGAGVIIPASCGIPALAGCSVGFLGGAMNGLGNIMQFAGESGNGSRYIPDKVKNEVRERDGNKCVYCGVETNTQKNTNPTKSEIDHITPYSKGGSNELSNLNNSCRNCNRKKRNMLIGEFLEKFGGKIKNRFIK